MNNFNRVTFAGFAKKPIDNDVEKVGDHCHVNKKFGGTTH